MKTVLPILTFLTLLGLNPFLHAEGQGDEVVVVYNTHVSESKDVADHYAKMRMVPSSQVLGLPMPDKEEISRTDFRETIQKPLSRILANKELLRFGSHIALASNGVPEHLVQSVTKAKIRYLVLCYGVPLRIGEDRDLQENLPGSKLPELRRNEAAIDSELACLPIQDQSFKLGGPFPNRWYGCTNASVLNPTNDILMVARLDGPTPAIARSLVDKAIQAETDGLWGRAYCDFRGITNAGYKVGDDIIHEAASGCRRFGFDTIVDTNAATFPVTFPMSQIAWYAGWYDEHASGPFSRPTVEFMPGAFAYHLHSFSATSLRTKDKNWVGPFLDRGVTITMGCVAEPYLAGTPDVGIFTVRFLLSGFSFGEAAYAAQPVLSWQTTVVGDPLYRPVARSPQELHDDLEARHSKLAAWSYIRIINLKILESVPISELSIALENIELTAKSAVLQEKLASLYALQGKPSATIHALQQALKFDPSPQQRVRLLLVLADRLVDANRYDEAFQVCQQFLKDCPDYPDMTSIHRRLSELSLKLNHTPTTPSKAPVPRRAF